MLEGEGIEAGRKEIEGEGRGGGGVLPQHCVPTRFLLCKGPPVLKHDIANSLHVGIPCPRTLWSSNASLFFCLGKNKTKPETKLFFPILFTSEGFPTERL